MGRMMMHRRADILSNAASGFATSSGEAGPPYIAKAYTGIFATFVMGLSLSILFVRSEVDRFNWFLVYATGIRVTSK